ncbi:DUF1534 domain-containing protein [Pseudomonas syringae]|nr:DUF1534 domain-containing protein [Pseudomonas syringae]MCF5211185.1 DUF1534 domain-containing protein [Pseudomonas syringae]MCF5216593.1 DUF1534 domain-containing protein [Pseudomonas syringae]MCF5220590.1 DUF1534 domain-containing protein [Pseudomonas syringae]MCF5266103.1 DUF1534 domain-containing protein [Pseudomonas syringae]
MPTPCGHERCSCGHLSFLTLQHGNAVHDAPRRKRTQSVQKGMRRRASHDSCDNRSSRSGVTPEGWMQPLEASWVNIQSRQNSQP